jgi:aerobic-type carbon monoxide dehydrogenase small subunit (CoxS/CutS family)
MRIIWGTRRLSCLPGETVAAALRRSGIVGFGAASDPGPRYFCGIGLCQGCAVLIDGDEPALACLTIVRDGMQVAPVIAGETGECP